ncbi:hypothetical protein NFI96_020072, partial [Prochilodus magdalenae]
DQTFTKPALSILKSSSRGGLEVCLAAGFYPNEGDMVLTGSDKSDNLNLNKAVLSSSGKYFYAGYSKETIKECKVNDVVVPDKKDTGSTGGGAQAKCPDQPSAKDQGSQSSRESGDLNDPKSNTLSLVVTGLRLLLAKAVAVNVLMTIKAFLV